MVGLSLTCHLLSAESIAFSCRCLHSMPSWRPVTVPCAHRVCLLQGLFPSRSVVCSGNTQSPTFLLFSISEWSHWGSSPHLTVKEPFLSPSFPSRDFAFPLCSVLLLTCCYCPWACSVHTCSSWVHFLSSPVASPEPRPASANPRPAVRPCWINKCGF